MVCSIFIAAMTMRAAPLATTTGKYPVVQPVADHRGGAAYAVQCHDHIAVFVGQQLRRNAAARQIEDETVAAEMQRDYALILAIAEA